MMACKEKIDYLLLDVRELEKTIAGMRDAEMYPVSFFSRSFELTRKILDALHTLESVQVDLLRKQMEEHEAMLSELPYTAGIRRPENVVPAATLSGNKPSGEVSGKGASFVPSATSEKNALSDEPSLSGPDDPVSGTDEGVMPPVPPVFSGPAAPPVAGICEADSANPEPDAENSFSPEPAVLSGDKPELRRPGHVQPVESAPAPAGNDPDATIPAAVPGNPVPPAVPVADGKHPDSANLTGETAGSEKIPVEKSEENPGKTTVPEIPCPVPPAPEPRGERLGNAGLSVNELLERRRLSDLRRALSLNDRFYFRRELFGGNEARMNQVIDRLNGFSSLEESLAYLRQELEWNLDDQAVADFIKLIEKRYA